jgi:hypothetical protein
MAHPTRFRHCNAPGLPDEIFFSIITHQAIRRAGLGSVKELVAAIRRFIDDWNQRGHPFV